MLDHGIVHGKRERVPRSFGAPGGGGVGHRALGRAGNPGRPLPLARAFAIAIALAAIAVAVVAGCATSPPAGEAIPADPAPAAVHRDTTAGAPGAGAHLDDLVAGPPRRIGDRFLFTLLAPEAKSVTVAGTFNGWLPNATPLVRHGDLWYVLVDVPFGRHRYRYLIDGTRWILDPENPRRGGDGMGGMASMLIVR